MKVRWLMFALLILSPVMVRAQSNSIPFTLNWQANTTTDTSYALHSLLTYNGQPHTYSVCGYSPERYDIWCGEIVHYDVPATFDFNFPDGFLLQGCSKTGGTTYTTVTSPGRRTITESASFSCTDADSVLYMVDTLTKTKQYQASCGRYACWQTFGPGQQLPITGTVTAD